MKPITSKGNNVQCLLGGDEYFQLLLRGISDAQVFIHIQLYILGNDRTGQLLMEHLISASQRGVRVYLMLDAFGSSWVREKHLKQWSEEGIKLKLFARRYRFKKLSLGRRQHSKVVIIDNRFLSVGGLNFADRYSGYHGAVPWMDFTTWIEGPAAAQLNHKISVYWPRRIRRELRNIPIPVYSKSGNTEIQILVNDWIRGKNAIKPAYLQALKEAKFEIIIVAGYFFPSRRLVRLLKKKAQEGVQVKLIFSAISDVPLVKPASEYYYNRLRKAGVEIREWQASMLHAKVALIDKSWLTIGSYNLNQLSDYAGLETNVLMQDASLGQQFYEEHIDPLLSNTHLVSAPITNPIRQIFRWMAFLIVRAALRLILIRK